jgi:Holliday junction resolvase RusA-like endonuclease
VTTVIRPLLGSFPVIGKPASLQSSNNTKQRWQSLVTKTAQMYQKKPLGIDVKLDLQIDWFSPERQNRADVDNVLKPVVDALKNVIYVDDNQVSSVSARYNDVNSVLTFISEPLCIVKPLLSGQKEYVYIRAYRVW